MAKTQYFQNCMGVFQGGGCKGGAYVGAFKALSNWGVSFSELVGTSAGSIVAVLIGAGATPVQLDEIMSRLDFSKFLNISKKLPEVSYPWYSKILLNIPEPLNKYCRIYLNLGMYNSVQIKMWIEKELEQLINKPGHLITFDDLIIPTSVVVTNLKTKRVEIMSTHKTPSKFVGDAVQASCNIPFFFQPIEMQYIDGGVLSNLPTFIFNDNDDKIYNRILAFSLESEPETLNAKGIRDYSKVVLNTTLEGSQDLQLSLQKNLNIIKISTGKISATDFDKINTETLNYLKKQGENAINVFFSAERANIKSEHNKQNISFDRFGANNLIIESIQNRVQEILIFESENKWVYDLFPTLLKWAMDKTQIKIISQKPLDSDLSAIHRNRILEAFGINIVYVENIPLNAFIIDGDHSENCKSIVLNRMSSSDKNFISKVYAGTQDYKIIDLLRSKFLSMYSGSHSIINTITIKKTQHHELISLIKNVKQYNNDKVQVTIEEINISDVVFLTKYVRADKYRQIQVFFELFKRFGLDYFEPAEVNYTIDKTTLITPPVVEKIDNKYYLIEGNTRLTYAFKNGINSIKCVVVKDVDETLPSDGRFSAKEMLLTDKFKEGGTRYSSFTYGKFRDIEKEVRNPKESLQ